MGLLISRIEKEKKVLFDTNIWNNKLFDKKNNRENLEEVEWIEEKKKQREIIVCDSWVNLFEITYYFPNRRALTNEKLENVIKKIVEKLKIIDKITDDNLPSPPTLIRKRIWECLGIYNILNNDYLRTLNDEYSNEKNLLSTQRKNFIKHPNLLKEETTKKMFEEDAQRRKSYKDKLEEWRGCFQHQSDKWDDFINSKKFKSDMFNYLMERFKISEESIIYDLKIIEQWEKVDVLKSVANCIINILKETCISRRKPQGSDLSDIDFAVYIPIVDIFVTENKKDFHGILPNKDEQKKILTWEEFKNQLGCQKNN
jgi:predicted nucleic acid-binding protein